MGLFRYEAVDNSGKVLHGAMNARDEQEVAQNLSSMGYTLRVIHTKGGARPAAGASAVGTAPQPQTAGTQIGGAQQAATSGSGVPVSVKSIVHPRALAAFFRQLATMVRSGIPLYQAFGDMAQYVRDRRLKKVLPHIEQALQSGQSFSGAMATFPHIFPVHTTASVWAGELSGKLEVALVEVAVDMEQEASDIVYGRIGWGIGKAYLIGGIFIVPLCSIFYYVGDIINGKAEGGPAGVIQWLSHSLMISSIVAAFVIVSWIVWGRVKRIPSVKRTLDGMLLRVPVWGSMHKSRGLSRFLHVLDSVYSAGIGVDAAWDAASLTPRNSDIAEKLRLTRRNVASNSGLTNLISASGVFEQEYVGIAAAGEKSGQIPDALSNLEHIYEDVASSRRKIGKWWSISALLTSALIVGGAGLIVMAKSYSSILWDLLGGFG